SWHRPGGAGPVLSAILTQPQTVRERVPTEDDAGLSIQMTRHGVTTGERLLLRDHLGALGHRVAAARMEATARRWIDRRRDFAGQDDLLPHDVGVRRQRGREERLRIWMQRI